MAKTVCRGLVFLLLFFLMVLIAEVPCLAFESRGAEEVTIAREEIVGTDLYAAGEIVTIDGTVQGDLCAAGREVIINGEVQGGVFILAETVTIRGSIGRTMRALCRSLILSGTIGGDGMVAASEVHIADTASLRGDLLFGAGRVSISGLVGSDILGSAREVTLDSGVHGDVKLKATRLTLTPQARIQGNLTYWSEEQANIQSGAQVAGLVSHNLPHLKADIKKLPSVNPFLRIVRKGLALLMAFITGLVFILLAPRRVMSISESIGSHPWPSLGWGAVILFVTPFAAVTVFFTILGIPLAMIALALYLMAIYVSQIPVGMFLGRSILRRYTAMESTGSMAGGLALGLFVITLLRLIPYLRFFVCLAVILFGLGAVIVAEKKRCLAKNVRSGSF